MVWEAARATARLSDQVSEAEGVDEDVSPNDSRKGSNRKGCFITEEMY